MPDKWQNQLIKSLHKANWFARADPPFMMKDPKTGKMRWSAPEDRGRPDIIAIREGYGVHIETKSAANSFSFSDWRKTRPKQVEWWSEYGKSGHLWIALFLGGDPPNRNPEKYKPRRLYLFPYFVFLYVEHIIKPYQSSLPYRAGKGFNKDMQKHKLDAENLLAPYALHWLGKDTWELPQSHPFQSMYNPGLPQHHSREWEIITNDYKTRWLSHRASVAHSGNKSLSGQVGSDSDSAPESLRPEMDQAAS